mgnify:CR=1 FL=1
MAKVVRAEQRPDQTLDAVVDIDGEQFPVSVNAPTTPEGYMTTIDDKKKLEAHWKAGLQVEIAKLQAVIAARPSPVTVFEDVDIG